MDSWTFIVLGFPEWEILFVLDLLVLNGGFIHGSFNLALSFPREERDSYSSFWNGEKNKMIKYVEECNYVDQPGMSKMKHLMATLIYLFQLLSMGNNLLCS